MIESGRRKPTVETIEKIAKALKLPFHLLSLLGSEKADIKKTPHEHIAGLSLALTKLLLEVSDERAAEENNNREPWGSANPQRARSRVSPRRRSVSPPRPRKKLASRVRAIPAGERT
jgi:transcriptional regulator with XRE-family HTH domain